LHFGVQSTVQWKQQEVPIPMFGISAQATNSSVWNDTNDAVEAVHVGTIGRVQFKGKDSPNPHALKVGLAPTPSPMGRTACGQHRPIDIGHGSFMSSAHEVSM
jgi:hypothetical protein